MWALNAVAIDILRHRLPLPDVLAGWVAGVLDGSVKRPVTGARSTRLRDYGLARMVAHLSRKFVMTPTRNDGSPERSACDMVGTALGYDYKTIVKAYLEYKDRFT